MREYQCMGCNYSSPDVAKILLMPDGETEYCEPCYRRLVNEH